MLKLTLAGGIALVWGGAFYFLGTSVSVVLGILAALTLIFISRNPLLNPRDVYALFIVAHIVGYSWFVPAFQKFVESSVILAVVCFSLFALYGSLQFFLFILLARFSSRTRLRACSLDVALSWLTLETLFFKPFDWYLSHTLTTQPILIQTADLFGAAGVGFVLVWILTLAADSLHAGSLPTRGRQIAALLGAMVLIGLVGAYGFARVAEFNSVGKGPRVKALIIQNDTTPIRQFSATAAREIARQYVSLTEKSGSPDVDLILWPETSVMEPYLSFTASERSEFDSETQMPLHKPLLFGTRLSTDEDDFINSVAALYPGEQHPQAYEKQIFFPLAEGDLFRSLSYTWQKSSRRVDYFDVPVPQGALRILPIVCFESTLTSFVASRSNRVSPQLLVDFSNLNWFRGTRAALQHEVMAQWRSVENRIPLLRVVNSGPSALILPNGSFGPRALPDTLAAITVEVSLGQPPGTFFQKIHQLIPLTIIVMVLALLRFQIINFWSRLIRYCSEQSEVLGQCKGVVLGGVGILCSLGYYLHIPTMTVIGLATGASPYPFVFNTFQGINYWAHDISIDLLGKNLVRAHHQVDASLFNKLPGPHLYHMAYAIPFAFAPVYPRELWESALQGAFCGSQANPATLLPLLDFEDALASVKITIKERFRSSAPEPQTWEYRIVCRGNP